jgi:cell division protein FtsB
MEEKIPDGIIVRVAGAIFHEQRDEIAQLRAELSRLKRDREELRLGAGPHNDPKDCPTFYDHCHCTVENLLHNIERAEKAEDELAQLRARIEELEAHLATDEALLNERNRLLNEIPECPIHGAQCIPHAIAWIAEARAALEE